MGHLIPLVPAGDRPPKPEWLKVRAPGSPNYTRLKGLMRDLNLHTVCEEARCPNIGECWHHGTATFMILGDVCTRACAYCAIAHGRPTAGKTAHNGYLHCGPVGSGHFVKMVHNGIEYGLMQAYGEGFDIMKNADSTGNRGADADR